MKQHKLSLLIIILIISSACFGQSASRNYMGHVNRAIKQYEKVKSNPYLSQSVLTLTFSTDSVALI